MGDYGKLASLMGTYHEMALFRQFAALNAKSLLYMQSELVHLEAELSNIGLEDAYSGDGQKEAFRVSLFKLKRSSGTDKDLQWRKVMEIREKLKEYSMYKINSSHECVEDTNILFARYCPPSVCSNQKVRETTPQRLEYTSRMVRPPRGRGFLLAGSGS